MIKHLTKHGNSLALIIDRAILELLEIDPAAPLSITSDGRSLIVSPATDAERERAFQTAMSKVNRRYGRALKRLAE